MKQKKHGFSLTRRRMVAGYLFILPWFVGFIAFYVKALAQTFRFSFSKMDILATGGYVLSNVGFDNYLYAFTVHGSFKEVLTNSMIDMLIDVPLIIFFSLFMAILLNRKFKCRGLIRAIFFLPIILNSGAISDAITMSAKMIAGGASTQAAEIASSAGGGLAFDIDYLIEMFMKLGISSSLISYLSSAVSRINDIITASGVQIIIFLAALQSIPPSMYEVSRIEGATGYETFWKVTFPMVMPHIITNVVYTIVDSFNDSEIVQLAYTTAFESYEYGWSSVFSIVSTALTCLILVIVVGIIQKRTFYYN